MKNWSKEIKKAENKEQARQIAIAFQQWSSEQNLSYGELIFYQNQLRSIAKKYGLIREFKENAII